MSSSLPPQRRVDAIIGSLTGMVTPYFLVAAARWASWNAGEVFEWGLLFGGPLFAAICGGLLGARLGRRWAVVAGLASGVVLSAIAGAVAMNVVRRP